MGTVENLNMTNIRSLLADIYFGKIERRIGESELEWEERLTEHKKYIIPLKGNWTIPTIDPEEGVSTWVGYQMSSLEPIATAVRFGNIIKVECKLVLRLWAMGRQAEEFITDVLFWDYRRDITGMLDKYLARMIPSPRKIFSQLYSQEGFNSELCWITDIGILSYYKIDMSSERLQSVVFEPGKELRNVPEETDIQSKGVLDTFQWKDELSALLEEADNE